MTRAALATGLLAALLPLPAHADALYAIYAAGRYEDAIKAGEAAHSAPGFAIAARAALAEAVPQDPPCMSCLERAEGFARRAVAANPAYADGQIWLAVALGYETRIIGPVEARLKGLPGQAKEAIDRAVKEDPANPYGLAALGGWNIELVRLGGDYLADKLYGASEVAGLALFERAVKAAPGNVAVHFQIALSLAGFDRARFTERIHTELEAAIASTPETAYERLVRGRARDLLALIKQGDDDAIETRVRKYQGYP